MTNLTAEQTLSIINIQSQIHSCTACSLHVTCAQPVPFRSSTPPPHIVIALGEFPDKTEDAQNSPFVGHSGLALNYHAKQCKLNITAHLNVLCCKPPNNKIPESSAPYYEADRSNLATQIQFLRPSIR